MCSLCWVQKYSWNSLEFWYFDWKGTLHSVKAFSVSIHVVVWFLSLSLFLCVVWIYYVADVEYTLYLLRDETNLLVMSKLSLLIYLCGLQHSGEAGVTHLLVPWSSVLCLSVGHLLPDPFLFLWFISSNSFLFWETCGSVSLSPAPFSMRQL